MDKDLALSYLRSALALKGVNRSTIGRKLNIHPSHVSRIAAGQFAKLEGNAAKVCKYAQSLVQQNQHALTMVRGSDIERKLAQLSATNPLAARAVADLIAALADGPTSPTACSSTG